MICDEVRGEPAEWPCKNTAVLTFHPILSRLTMGIPAGAAMKCFRFLQTKACPLRFVSSKAAYIKARLPRLACVGASLQYSHYAKACCMCWGAFTPPTVGAEGATYNMITFLWIRLFSPPRSVCWQGHGWSSWCVHQWWSLGGTEQVMRSCTVTFGGTFTFVRCICCLWPTMALC